MADSLYVAPMILTRPTMLRPEHVEIGTEGELVTFTVGNSTLKIHYEDALKISQWLRMRAKEAKRKCGDTSRHWSVLAMLDGIRT